MLLKNKFPKNWPSSMCCTGAYGTTENVVAAECPTLPQDDFCLMLSDFNVSGPPSIQYEENEGDRTEDLSEDEADEDPDAVPTMPSFPSNPVMILQPTILVFTCSMFSLPRLCCISMKFK